MKRIYAGLVALAVGLAPAFGTELLTAAEPVTPPATSAETAPPPATPPAPATPVVPTPATNPEPPTTPPTTPSSPAPTPAADPPPPGMSAPAPPTTSPSATVPTPATAPAPAPTSGSAGASPSPATPAIPAIPEKKPELSPAEKLFGEGRDALFQGQYDKAVELLTKALAADNTKTSYRLYLARAYRYSGKVDEAGKLLEEILKTTPDHVEAGQLLGEIYAKSQRWKDLVNVLEPLLKYRHDYPTYHLLAEAKYSLNDLEKARKYYEEAIKLNPESGVDHYQLGNIYLAGNFFALAAQSYQAALRLGLESPVLHYKLGSAYFNLRNYFGQISVITVKAGQPGSISGEWYLIEAVPGQKDVFHVAPSASAIYQVAKAIAEGIKDQPDIHVLKANIYLNARRFKQAYEMFKAIGPTVPAEDKALFHYYYAQSAFGAGQYEEYLTLLGEAIKLDKGAYEPTLVDAYLRVAEQYNQAGDLDKYIAFLGKAVAESPQNVSLHVKLGDAYEEARDYGKAVVQWQMVLDLEPEHPNRTKLLNLIGKYGSQPAKPAEPAAKKPVDKPAEAAKPADKPAEKPAEVKPAEVKPAEVKPAEVKPVEPSKPAVESKPVVPAKRS